MAMWVVWMVLMLLMFGCSPAAVTVPVAGLQGVATAIESVGLTASGFKQTRSTLELNSANKGLVEAQTAMMQTQVEQTRGDHQQVMHERTVTAKLLRGMSAEYHEPMFKILAEWVEAGGDSDFAFKYALSRVDEERVAQESPHQTLSLNQPELVPVVPPTSSTQPRRLPPAPRLGQGIP